MKSTQLSFPDRCRLYASQQYQFALFVEKLAERIERKAIRQIKRDPEARALLKKRRENENQIRELPEEQRHAVSPRDVYKADLRQGVTTSYYTAEARALAASAEYDALCSRLKAVQDKLYEIKKKYIREALEEEKIPGRLREAVESALRNRAGYAPARNSVIIEKPRKDRGRYREIDLWGNLDDPDDYFEVTQLLKEEEGRAGWSPAATRRRGRQGGKRKKVTGF